MAMAVAATRQEEADILDGLETFLDRRVLPVQARISEVYHDARRYFGDDGKELEIIEEARREVRMASAEAGYYTLFTAEELGGSGFGNELYVRAIERIGRRYGPGDPAEPLVAEAIANWFTGPSHVWQYAQPELRDKILPGLLDGSLHGAFGLSEPDAGSDVFAMATSASRDGDDWIINGGKQWTSYSAYADFVLVFAATDLEAKRQRAGGVTCFYVPTSHPGYSLDSMVRIYGDSGGREGILSFTDMRIPDAWRIGDVGDGIRMAFKTITKTRLWQASRSVGEGQWALDRALEYAKVRETFGKKIIEHQSVQNLLADMAVELYTARAATLETARRADAGEDVRTETAIVKYHATNAAFRVFDSAIQVHGGMGITNEVRLIDGWKTARTSRITEGSDQIMQRTIALQMARGGAPRW